MTQSTILRSGCQVQISDKRYFGAIDSGLNKVELEYTGERIQHKGRSRYQREDQPEAGTNVVNFKISLLK